jgi:hypothetical protein
LPDPLALDDLVSMTGVRCLLLRPAADWAGPHSSLRRNTASWPCLEFDGWLESMAGDLLVVRRRGRIRTGSKRIASGAVAGRTVLGTPSISTRR